MKTEPSVSYFDIAGCDRKFFKCASLAATLSIPACESNWRKAQSLPPDAATPLQRCRACPIGAAHAGEKVMHRSAVYQASICPRTRRWSGRLIQNRLGISSYNRQREFVKGCDAKGHLPQFTLDPRRLGLIVNYGGSDQRCVDLRDELTADTIELAVQSLRVVPGRVAFCRPLGRPPISTPELAAQVGAAPAAAPANRVAMFKRSPSPTTSRAQQGPRALPAAPGERLPNEFRTEAHPRAIDPAAALARLLARRTAS